MLHLRGLRGEEELRAGNCLTDRKRHTQRQSIYMYICCVFTCECVSVCVHSRTVFGFCVVKQDTAERFGREAGLEVDVDFASITDRMAIRSAVS